MKNILNKLPEIFILVLLLSVISLRNEATCFINSTKKSESNKSKLKLEDAKEFFKEATSIKVSSEDFATVKDNEGHKIGYLLSTSPLSDNIIGYAGTVPVIVAIDINNMVKGIKLMPNMESPGFIRRISNQGFLSLWDNMLVDSALVADIDVVSGASLTSGAVKKGIKLRLEKFSKQKVEENELDIMQLVSYLASALVIILALLSFFFPTKYKKYRNILLILSILILGFWQGDFISLSLLYGWFINGVPIGGKIILVSIFVLAVVFPLFLNKSFYCAYVCPYGAAQELAGKIKKNKKTIPYKFVRVLTKVRMIVFYLIIFLIILGLDPDITELEPFSAFIYNVATPWVISIALTFLVLSIFISRAWCRYFCPTGYFFDIFKKGKTFKK